MSEFTKISSQALLILKECLSLVYWTKSDLKFFLQTTIKNNAILNTIDWGKKKAEIVDELLKRMSGREDMFKEDILFLISETANITDFSNLEKFDNAKSTIPKAKDAVKRLREHSKGYFEKKEDLEKVQNAKIEKEKTIAKHSFFTQGLEQLKQEFLIISTNENPQERGFQFEKFLFDLFVFFQIPTVGSFKIQTQQIDGAFSFEGKEFIMEAKWTKTPIADVDIAAFEKKLNKKLKTTLGLFISMSGFAENCANSDKNQIIFINGSDLYKILENRQTLNEFLSEKIKLAAHKGVFYDKK